MKKLIRITTVLGFAFLLVYSPAWSSELIKPTRTLDSGGDKPGKLSVCMSSKGFGQIRDKNKRGFQVPKYLLPVY